MDLALTLAVAAALGVLFDRLGVPGGLIIGAMVGAAAVTVGRGEGGGALPQPLVTAAFVVLGAKIGTSVTRDLLGELDRVALGAVVSAVVFIAFGLLVAVALQAVGLAPRGGVLATSPGALSVMSAAAAEQGVGAQVAVFHTVRVILVIFLLLKSFH